MNLYNFSEIMLLLFFGQRKLCYFFFFLVKKNYAIIKIHFLNVKALVFFSSYVRILWKFKLGLPPNVFKQLIDVQAMELLHPVTQVQLSGMQMAVECWLFCV